MTDWQRGYGDAYVNPIIRPYPVLKHNYDYMKGYMAAQEDWQEHHG